jgi:hypothetical protein
MSALLPKPLTDKEVKEGSVKRDAFRKQIVKDDDFMKANLNTFKKIGSSTFSSASKYQKFIQKDLAWINANPELSARQVDARQKVYVETSEDLVKTIVKDTQNDLSKLDIKDQVFLSENYPFTQFRKNLIQQVNERKSESQNNEINTDDENSISSAFKSAFKWGVLIFFILIGLRIASFCANTYLHRSVGFRILAFVYGFFFSPLLFPYYSVREIYARVTGDESSLPRSEGFLPLFPYKLEESSSFLRSLLNNLFGYADTPILQEYIKCKKDIHSCQVESVLAKSRVSILEQLEKDY